MKVELHLHTSRYSGCAMNTPEQMMQRLIDTGYGAVYITEHDAVWRDSEIEDLRRLFPQLRIFSGVELSLGSHHLLVLGTGDPEYVRIYDPADVVLKARREGHLTILAHPFRWPGGAEMLWDSGPLPDAIEYRTCNQDSMMGGVALDTAARLHLPVVSAGDIHSLLAINRFYIHTDRDLDYANDIRQIVIDGRYTIWPIEEQ